MDLLLGSVDRIATRAAGIGPARRAWWCDELRKALSGNVGHPLPAWPGGAVGDAAESWPVDAGGWRELLEEAARIDLGPNHPIFADPGATPDAWLAEARSTDRLCAFPHLIRETECWLPYDGDFTFRTFDPSGRRTTFGSVYRLYRELLYLNRNLWEASAAEMRQWALDPEVPARRRAFGTLVVAAGRAAGENYGLRLIAE